MVANMPPRVVENDADECLSPPFGASRAVIVYVEAILTERSTMMTADERHKAYVMRRNLEDRVWREIWSRVMDAPVQIRDVMVQATPDRRIVVSRIVPVAALDLVTS